jgi:hypothetical protein
MFKEITYYLIFGKPLIMYLGITTLTLFLSAAVVGGLILKGKNISIKWHTGIVKIAIAFALVHAFLGVTQYF